MPHDPTKFITLTLPTPHGQGIGIFALPDGEPGVSLGLGEFFAERWPTPDPATDPPLPHDDASAHAALRRLSGSGSLGKVMAEAMCGLYSARRGQGDSVLDAYKAALLAALPASTRAER